MNKYINLFVDYGFKKLFGTEEDSVKEMIYKNVEQIGEVNGTQTNYFDVYCTTESGVSSSWRCRTAGSPSSRTGRCTMRQADTRLREARTPVVGGSGGSGGRRKNRGRGE